MPPIEFALKNGSKISYKLIVRIFYDFNTTEIYYENSDIFSR
jgi:hypothetical protein